MTANQKKEAEKGFNILSHAMSIIGFPILIAIGVKTYNRGEQDHETIIRLVESHQQLQREVDNLITQNNTMREYVYRGTSVKLPN